MSGTHTYGNWHTNHKGYARFHSGSFRLQYVHRVVFQQTAGRSIRAGFQIHHMGDRLCFCSHNLLECPPEFNPRTSIRDPYTGQFLSAEAYQRRYA